MDRPPPPPGSVPSSTSQRTLAAIVFTDVVGFSARMHRDEVGTLKLLDRDFAEMRTLCAEHEGSVLKTTGDGLLLTFSSAVQAVACALAMQRQFAAEAKESPGSGGLQHRIGIHLGDILVQNQDVMGDGVNIASRLQAEAEPGGICISQTVYDVVKNKVEMQVVSLGARELKNISSAMPVYRILLEAAMSASGSRPPMPATTSVTAPAPSSTRRRLVIASSLAAALVLLFAIVLLVNHGAKPETPVVAAVTPPAPTTAPAPAPSTTATPTANRPAAETSAAMTDDEFQREFTRRREQMQQMRTQYLDKYDFEGFIRALGSEKGEASVSRGSGQMILRSAEQMLKLREWLEYTLSHYGRQRPLLVHDLSGDATKDTRVFMDPYKKFIFFENGRVKPADWAELKPAVVGSIIMSALRDTKPAPNLREAVMGAQAFGQFYNLPAMKEALAGMGRMRAGGPKAN